jgi:hypothetical protein
MQIGTTSSLVGVSVANPQVVWASGSLDVFLDEPPSPGVVLRTVDGGQSWQDVTPPGGEELHFHDIEAFDRNHALALAVGLAKPRRSIGPPTGAPPGSRRSKTRSRMRSTMASRSLTTDAVLP